MKEPCHNNRPAPKAGYWLLTRWPTVFGRYLFKPQWIENVMTKECQQPGRGHDPLPGCEGCNHLQRYDDA